MRHPGNRQTFSGFNRGQGCTKRRILNRLCFEIRKRPSFNGFSSPSGLNKSIRAGQKKKSARYAQRKAKPAKKPKLLQPDISESVITPNSRIRIMVVKVTGHPLCLSSVS
ncbi:MAG: hypothetical protein U9Q89_02735 [Thermodesulfobacteriota bacterium]|nr:hypothetical protein [Thermodesulfobacteriota bacterium]